MSWLHVDLYVWSNARLTLGNVNCETRYNFIYIMGTDYDDGQMLGHIVTVEQDVKQSQRGKVHPARRGHRHCAMRSLIYAPMFGGLSKSSCADEWEKTWGEMYSAAERKSYQSTNTREIVSVKLRDADVG
jgi:hypothetical protein